MWCAEPSSSQHGQKVSPMEVAVKLSLARKQARSEQHLPHEVQPTNNVRQRWRCLWASSLLNAPAIVHRQAPGLLRCRFLLRTLVDARGPAQQARPIRPAGEVLRPRLSRRWVRCCNEACVGSGFVQACTYKNGASSAYRVYRGEGDKFAPSLPTSCAATPSSS